MNLTFRAANTADLPAIDRVFRDTFCATFAHLYAPEDLAAFLAQFTPEAWRAEFEDPAFKFQVAEADGALAGYAKLGPSALPHSDPDGAIELRQLYVEGAWHGRGIAPQLMDWGLAEARAQGAKRLYLSVYVDNHRARRFYDRYGFVPVGPYHFMVGNHADEDTVMRLDL